MSHVDEREPGGIADDLSVEDVRPDELDDLDAPEDRPDSDADDD